MKGKIIEVPLWVWNVYWILTLLGADHWYNLFVPLLMLALPYAKEYDKAKSNP